ncbi:alpha/beta hydrolase [Olivibacter sitiensis]|uniref:alpha/beta hydrolase n=1 Tax=Olivibacter sitiensis TaxID=376470 RepID=UPI0004004050|nr:alpha/beta hydrolase family protein [Olivibacter sitiensis]
MKYQTKMRFVFFILLFACSRSYAAQVDTVITFSKVMGKEIKAVVIKPDSCSTSRGCPVVYLLHGYGGNYGAWINNVPAIKKMVDEGGFMVVCPDGGFGSWYWNSPIDAQFQYETYVSQELVAWVDKTYSTIADKKGRGITGLSMGGHGALYLAIKHPDVFGAAGSQSGGVDIRPFPNNWDMAKRLGPYWEQKERWENHTVINLLHLIKPNELEIIIDCGTEDFFYQVNQNLHQEMLYRNIKHDYIVRPGAHNWDYWRNSISAQLLFMRNFFERELTL